MQCSSLNENLQKVAQYNDMKRSWKRFAGDREMVGIGKMAKVTGMLAFWNKRWNRKAGSRGVQAFEVRNRSRRIRARPGTAIESHNQMVAYWVGRVKGLDWIFDGGDDSTGLVCARSFRSLRYPRVLPVLASRRFSRVETSGRQLLRLDF